MRCRVQWRTWSAAACLVCLLLICGGCSGFFRPMGGEQSVITKEAESSTSVSAEEKISEHGEAENSTKDVEADHTEEKWIYVHVCGCVKNPGLYTFAAGIRAGDAVEHAGGFTGKADTSAVNLAEALSDGMQLYIPSVEETEEGRDSGSYGQSSTGDAASGQTKESEEDPSMVNINTAGPEELMTLSGIGEARAQAILSYREENGDFSTIEDIKNVSGIGEGIFDRIKNMITV